MKSRIIIVFVSFLILWAVLISRAAYLQVIPNPKLEELKSRQFQTSVKLKARRGAIYDRNGRELAVSIASYSLYADPYMIKNPADVADKLSEVVDRGYNYLLRRLKKEDRRFVWLRRRLHLDLKKKIEKLNIKGLGFIEESKRVYPNGHLLSHTIGFVGSEEQGLEGLEQYYEEELSGPEKKVKVSRDAWGRPLLFNGSLFTGHPDGSDLELTIDSELQFRLESELHQTLRQQRAKSVHGVVLDVKTFEVLAMASLPDYNANRPLYYDGERRRNPILLDTFEPGSVMKTFSVAAALRENLVKPNTVIDCEGGRIKVDGRIIREADRHHEYSELSVADILAKSSNIGAAKLALKLGDQRLFKTLKDFGFGQRSGVGFPGESPGLLKKPPWRDHFLASVSFGHSIAVTPLQLAAAYAAIANDGVLKKPYLVKSIGSGQSKKQFKPQKIRRVLSKEDAEMMRLMLTGVTSSLGTGNSARFPGFLVAGKTGTAQKVDQKEGGYLPDTYISSFAGFVPAHNPRFVVFVSVDEPKEEYYASQVAAPLFSKIARFAVRKAGLSPTLLDNEDIMPELKRSPLSQVKPQKKSDETLVPDVRGMSLRAALSIMKKQGFQTRIKGRGQVKRTKPEAGRVVQPGNTIKLFLRPISAKKKTPNWM